MNRNEDEPQKPAFVKPLLGAWATTDCLTEDALIEIGFEKIPHFTVMKNLLYRLGRNRFLSIGNVGTPNEMLWIYSTEEGDTKAIGDLVCLHNYDHDGYLTKPKLETLIQSIGRS